jgi:hypothetical protein
MVRERLLDRKAAEEKLIDIAHQTRGSDCKEPVCFVLDPMHIWKSRRRLEQELWKETDGLKVRAMVRPLTWAPKAVVRCARRGDVHPVQYILGMYAELRKLLDLQSITC